MNRKNKTLYGELTYREKWKNELTGKEVEVQFVPRPVDTSRKAKAKYVMVFDKVSEAFREGIIDFDEYAILNFCVSLLDWEYDYVVHPDSGQKLNVKEVSLLMRKDEDYVRKTITSLKDKGFLQLVKEGKGYSIKVPQNIGYRGLLQHNPYAKGRAEETPEG